MARMEFRASVNVRGRKGPVNSRRPIYTHITAALPYRNEVLLAAGAIRRKMKQIGMEVVDTLIQRRVVGDWQTEETIKEGEVANG